MKITLTRYDVMEILCNHFNLPHTDSDTLAEHIIQPDYDEIYWEGNPENKKEN